jgi:hypothetical protein
MSQSKQLALSLAEMLEALAPAGSRPLANAWADALGVQEDSPDLYLAVITTYGRLRDLGRLVLASDLSPRAKELYSSAIGILTRLANPTHLTSAANAAQHRDQINLLHLLADAFPQEVVPDVQPATLDELCKQLESILESLPEAAVEADVKALVQTSLDTLLMVLRSYKLFGPDGAARIYGSVAAELSRKVHQDPPKSAEGKSLLKKALAVTKAIGAVVIWTSALAGGIDNLLTDGSDIASFIAGPNDHLEGAKSGTSSAASKGAGPRPGENKRTD